MLFDFFLRIIIRKKERKSDLDTSFVMKMKGNNNNKKSIERKNEIVNLLKLPSTFLWRWCFISRSPIIFYLYFSINTKHVIMSTGKTDLIDVLLRNCLMSCVGCVLRLFRCYRLSLILKWKKGTRKEEC